MFYHLLPALVGILFALVSAQQSTIDYSQYVNPLIGSEGPFKGLAFGGGDIFVGGAVPFGVAKVGIDTYEPNVSFSTINGGYTPRGLVTAVSMMHESGTGGPAKYGIVPQMPLSTLDGVNVLDNRTYWQKRMLDEEQATVGGFKTKLENGVGIELAGARHSGVFAYNFPAGKEKHVLVDVSHYLPSEGSGGGEGQFFSGGEIHLQPDGKVYTGYGSYGGGFSNSAPLNTYFCGEFEEAPDEAQTFRGRMTDPLVRLRTCSNCPVPEPTYGNLSETSGPLNDRIGALFTWSNAGNATVRSRVGISMISAEKACAYKNAEITSWNVEDTRQSAVDEWNRDVFSKIQVPLDNSQNKTNIILLYSSLYFMHLMPSDRRGENPFWDNTAPHWDDFYTLWDIFRCTVSFYHLVQPAYYTSMIKSLIDIWKWTGYMPDGRSGEYNGLVQGGSNADNVLADAYVKGLPGVNWTEAYAAMVKDAEVTPYNDFDPVDPTNCIREGRGALTNWKELGYLTIDDTRSLSRSVEYALNDFSLYQLAKDLAPGDAEKYLRRSGQWQNNWNHNLTHKSFTGFLSPRKSDGTWNVTDYNPALCGGCEWSSITYEGTPFEYSFTVPHDMRTLIAFMGGPTEFERRLDYIFQPNTSEQNLGANGAAITTLMNIGNEPDFATPYEYNYLSKQWKSVRQSRELANTYFHNANYGVPGNSDAGALNSWLLWQMLGLYPVVTTPVYLIESPWFSDVNVTINGNQTLRITAQNLDNESSYYVQSVKVNGQAWDKNWLEHSDVMAQGGVIEFQMGSEPVVWERGGEVPPSPGHVVLGGGIGNGTRRAR